MIPAEILEYLQKIENKQLEQEKKEKQQKKVIIEMKRKIEELQNELANNNLNEENGEENVEQLDTSKYEQPKELSTVGIQCILRYLDVNKRLVLSIEYPHFRKIEKSVPFKLDYFRISPTYINVDGVFYHFKNNQQVCSFQEKGELPVNVTANWSYDSSFKKSIFKFVYNLFAGRIKFDVYECQICYCLPFELNIEVDRAVLGSSEGLAEAYCNLTHEISKVFFLDIETVEDFKFPWVRSVEVFAVVTDGVIPFHEELPNLPANKIYIHFSANITRWIDTVLKWCENKSRPLGSQLFLTAQGSLDETSIQTVLSSDQLVQFGFVSVSDERLSLPMDNNLEVKLTVRTDKDHFCSLYMSKCKFNRYYKRARSSQSAITPLFWS